MDAGVLEPKKADVPKKPNAEAEGTPMPASARSAAPDGGVSPLSAHEAELPASARSAAPDGGGAQESSETPSPRATAGADSGQSPVARQPDASTAASESLEAAEDSSGSEDRSALESRIRPPEEAGPLDAQAAAAEIIVQLYGLLRGLSLYDPNNSAIVRMLEALRTTLQRAFQGEQSHLRLQLLSDEFFVNGRLLKVDSQLYERGVLLSELLKYYGIGEISFNQEMSPDSLRNFVADLGRSVRTGENKLQGDGYEGIRVGKGEGHAIASFRFKPDRLAFWVYGGLLDVIDRLFEEHSAGRAPSLLPIKRVLQLIIDEMGRRSGIYQILAAVRNPAKPLDQTRARVSIAINAIGFAGFIGLPPTARMTMALGGILGGLSDSDSPDEAVRPLYGFPGLGDSAMPLALALHDTRSVLKGGSGGIPGRLLAVTEVYERMTAPSDAHAALSPHHALRAMVEGLAGTEEGPSQLFAEYKGPYPLGSPVELSDGGKAVVLGHGAGAEGKQRPLVARLESDGRLGERLNLSEISEPTIKKAMSPAEISLDLAAC